MPKDDVKTLKGKVLHVFAHRFVVQTESGTHLADLGPEATPGVDVKTGDLVEITGEQKKSELRIERLVLNGKAIELRHGDDDEDDEPVDPKHALDAVAATGYVVVAEPREKPKHFEILAKDKEDQHLEYHVKHDGEIKKSKLGDPADKKWKLFDAQTA